MIWNITAVFFVSSIVLGLMFKKSKDQLEAQSAELAALRQRSKRDIEALRHDHDKALDRHHRHAAQRLEGAHLPLVRDLLEGIDALEMAIDNADHEATSKQDLLDGIVMAHSSIARALEKHDVTPIAPEPRTARFDPALHEAIGVIDDDELPEKTVATLLRTGWHHPSKTLRPAMVQTSRPVPVSASIEEDDDEPTALDFSEPAEQQTEQAEQAVEHARK